MSRFPTAQRFSPTIIFRVQVPQLLTRRSNSTEKHTDPTRTATGKRRGRTAWRGLGPRAVSVVLARPSVTFDTSTTIR